MSVATEDLALPNSGPAPSRIGWRPPVALVLSVLWLYGIGSLTAVILAATTLRRGARSKAERAMLYAALGLGAIGVVLAVVSVALLSRAVTS